MPRRSRPLPFLFIATLTAVRVLHAENPPKLAITYDPAGNGKLVFNGFFNHYVAAQANDAADQIWMLGIDRDTSPSIDTTQMECRQATNYTSALRDIDLGSGFFEHPGDIAISPSGTSYFTWAEGSTTYLQSLAKCTPTQPLGPRIAFPLLAESDLAIGPNLAILAGVPVQPGDRLSGVQVFTVPGIYNSQTFNLVLPAAGRENRDPSAFSAETIERLMVAYRQALAVPVPRDDLFLALLKARTPIALSKPPINLTSGAPWHSLQPAGSSLPNGDSIVIAVELPDERGPYGNTEIGGHVVPSDQVMKQTAAGLSHLANLFGAASSDNQNRITVERGGANFWVAAAVSQGPPDFVPVVKLVTFDAQGQHSQVQTFRFDRESLWPNSLQVVTGRHDALLVAASDYLDHSFDGLYRLPFSLPRACVPSDTVVCLRNGRFRVEVTDKTAAGVPNAGHGVKLTDDTGYFTYFNPSNVESIVKVVDGCALGGNYWVFAAGLTSVLSSVTVTDSANGHFVNFVTPQGKPFPAYQNTAALPCDGTPASADQATTALEDSPDAAEADQTETATFSTAAATCVENATTMCLNHGRFAVSATYETKQHQIGNAQVAGITADTGYFWFFKPSNVEVVVKVLNACSGLSHSYWVFAGGLTDVKVVLTVRDTLRGLTKTYTNTLGKPFKPIQDTSAFATCP